MAIKLSSLTFSNKISKWFSLTARISSLSCANTVPINHETDDSSLRTADFEGKIQFLRNNLYPDSLIRVLDNTADLNSAIRIFKWVSLQKRFQHTVDSYHKMIFKLGLDGNVEQMEGLCHNMVNRCPNAKEALVSLIHSFVRHGRLNEATRVLVSMNSGGFKSSIDVYNVILDAIVRQNKGLVEYLFVYKEMVKAGVLPNVNTLNYLLEVLFETNRIDSALDQFHRLPKKGCNPNSKTFEIVIKGLVKDKRVEDAIVILGEMFDLPIRPDLSFYTCIIPLFCRENKVEEGIRLFRMMRASNYVADELTHEELIRCLCENLRLDDANTVLKEMIEIGATPACDLLAYMARCFCEAGKFDECLNFLEETCCDLTSPYNDFLESCCNGGKFPLAKITLGKMVERNIADSDSWNILIRWICENGEINKANEFLAKMIVFSVVPNGATHSALVIGNCNANRYETALCIFHRVCANLWVLDSMSYSELVEGLCRVEKMKEAVDVFYYMTKNGFSLHSSSLDMLINSMCTMGEVDKAIKLRSLAYNSGTPCTSQTYSTIMLGMSKLCKAKQLLAVLSQMLVEGCALDGKAYCILIQSTSAEKRIEDCALFFNAMVYDGFTPDEDTMYGLLGCLANHSRLNMVLTGINKLMFSDSEIVDSEMYSILINGLWKEGFKSEASLFLDLMLEKGWVPDAITHGLLIGSSASEKTCRSEGFGLENSTVEDTVSNILAEGLGND